jgi:UDP-N-acetylmuramoyl-L-alanyl-D-glutamate--2,6-diaminopimelate ligase
MEVSSHALCEDRVDQVRFQHAIYTNLTQDHLDYHHTMQAYGEAKARLFASPDLHYAMINQDDGYAHQMMAACATSCQIVTYGLNTAADVYAIDCQYGLVESAFTVSSPWGTHPIKIQSVGQFNIYNSLAVFSSLMAHGYAADAVVSVMAQLIASPGRMQRVAAEPCVLVDYAHTPDALKNVLSTLITLKAQSRQSSRIWVVFGCGGDRDRTKRPLMGKIASELADHIILTSDNPRTESPEQIVSEIAQGIDSSHKMQIIVDRKAAIHHVLEKADKGDIVLIAGKGHESYQHIGLQRHVFSDQDVVKTFLGS